MLTIFFLLLILPLCAADCTICLPKCAQPPFPGDLCSAEVVLSVKAKVLFESETRCVSVCDGKGVALGNLKTIYSVGVKKVFKGSLTMGLKFKVAGTSTFPTADPLRKGVELQMGKTYFFNLRAPMPSPLDDAFYVDRCDHPRLWSGLTRAQKRCLRRGTCC